jgi:hypothetical protein
LALAHIAARNWRVTQGVGWAFEVMTVLRSMPDEA